MNIFKLLLAFVLIGISNYLQAQDLLNRKIDDAQKVNSRVKEEIKEEQDLSV